MQYQLTTNIKMFHLFFIFYFWDELTSKRWSSSYSTKVYKWYEPCQCRWNPKVGQSMKKTLDPTLQLSKVQPRLLVFVVGDMGMLKWKKYIQRELLKKSFKWTCNSDSVANYSNVSNPAKFGNWCGIFEDYERLRPKACQNILCNILKIHLVHLQSNWNAVTRHSTAPSLLHSQWFHSSAIILHKTN